MISLLKQMAVTQQLIGPIFACSSSGHGPILGGHKGVQLRHLPQQIVFQKCQYDRNLPHLKRL